MDAAPGIYIPGYMMSPRRGLGESERVASASRDSHPGLYDVAPIGALEGSEHVATDAGSRDLHPGLYNGAPSGLRRIGEGGVGLPGFTSRAI